MPQVRCQGGLGGLVLHVASQMGAAQTAAQALLGGREELLDDIVGAVDNRHRPALLITGHGMAPQPVTVAVQIVENDPLRIVASQTAEGRGPDPLAQVLMVAPQVGSNRSDAGSGSLGPERGGGCRTLATGQFLRR